MNAAPTLLPDADLVALLLEAVAVIDGAGGFATERYAEGTTSIVDEYLTERAWSIYRRAFAEPEDDAARNRDPGAVEVNALACEITAEMLDMFATGQPAQLRNYARRMREAGTIATPFVAREEVAS